MLFISVFRADHLVSEKKVGRLFLVSASNVRSWTYKVSATWLPKYVLNKYNKNRHAKVDERKTHEASTLYKEL